MNRHFKTALLVILALFIIAPLFYYGTPFYESSPDIAYVKAKILHVMEGDIFTDPVSGYDTLHPPLYHILVAPLKSLGFSFRLILIIISVFSISLTILFTYKVIDTVFDKQIAFFTCLLLPFINDFMGSRGFLLANSFYFSVPFYLAGLWLYLKSSDSTRLTILSAILWGMTFFISPVYIFLIGLTFLYELIIARRPRRFGIMTGVYLLTISPYIAMAVSLYARDLWGNSIFAVWRGFPDGAWLTDFAWELISPAKKIWQGFPSYIHVGIILATIITIIHKRKVTWLIPIFFLAFILTYYHFSPQYAVRIHYLMSIFVVAVALSGIMMLKIKPWTVLIPVFIIMVYSIFAHYSYVAMYYEKEQETFQPFAETSEKLWINLDKHLVKGSYVFCTKKVYRYYIMTHHPVHSLGAYRTLEYFQVNSRVADELEKDYREVLYSLDYNFIKSIIRKYDIHAAIVSGSDYQLPLFQILAQAWHPVYEDEYFVIYKRM